MARASLLIVVCLVAVCCKGSEQQPGQFTVGMAYASGGKRDNSYNQSSALGLELARQSQNIRVREVEPARFADLEPALLGLSQAGVQLVIAVGPFYPDAVRRVAARFPSVNYVVIDGEVEGMPNVRSVLFKEEQGSYLVGALAGLATKKAHVGAVLAVDIPVLNKFFAGYRCGVLKTNPRAVVEKAVIGAGPESFTDHVKAAEVARFLLSGGVDVIFQVAGAAGDGVIAAVANADSGYAIGVDSNQNGQAPGRVLTSMLKRVDLVVVEAIRSASASGFQAGMIRVGIQPGGDPQGDFVGYQIDANNENLVTGEWRTTVDKLREAIRRGEIQVGETVDVPCS